MAEVTILSNAVDNEAVVSREGNPRDGMRRAMVAPRTAVPQRAHSSGRDRPRSVEGAAFAVVRAWQRHPMFSFFEVRETIENLAEAIERHRDTDRAHYRFWKRSKLRPVSRHAMAKLLRAWLEVA